MDIRRITPGYAVSPQISPSDMAAIREAGFAGVIDNRPDAEVPPELHAAAMDAAAQAAGLAFAAVPVTHGAMTPEVIEAQEAAMQATGGPVLAYCASGTRCSVVWALSQAGCRPTEEILRATAEAGYPLEQLRGALDAKAAQG